MKKIILLAACLAVIPASAEELRFVTALSEPVASFARLESVNSARPAEAMFVDFCNTGVNTGTISAKGLVKMNELRVLSGARAGSTSQLTYQITDANGLTVADNGSLRGAKLLANTADPQDITVAAGVNVGAASNFTAADLNRLKIASHTTIVPSTEYSKGYTMAWDNSYDKNYKVSSAGVEALAGTSYNSYLLRYRLSEEAVCGAGAPSTANSTRTRNCADDSKYGADYEGVINEKYSYLPDCAWKEVSNTCKKKESCADSSYKASHKSECCPSAPKTDTECWTAPSGSLVWVLYEKETNVSGSCTSDPGCGDGKPCTKEGNTCERTWKCICHPSGRGERECDGAMAYYTCTRGEYTKNGW